jgi:hypothetical protein
MNTELLPALREWFYWHTIAHENSTLLCQDLGDGPNCTRISNLCSERMSKLHEAGAAVDAFKGKPDILPELQALWDAEDDNGCSTCHLSASGPKHEECRQKMDRYWKAHEALIQWLEKDAISNLNTDTLNQLRSENQTLRNIIHYLYTHENYPKFALHKITPKVQEKLRQVLSEYQINMP